MLVFVVGLGLAVASALAVVAPAPAWAQGDPRVEARARYTAGKQKFDAGDYRGAIADFSAADQLAPSAVNDFNIALAHERLDDPGQAIRYYRSYLDRQPNAPSRAMSRRRSRRLDAAAKAAAAADEARRARPGAPGRGAPGRGGAPGGGRRRRRRHLRRRGGSAGRRAAPTYAPTYAPTGNPAIDRVAAVDLNAIRAAGPLPAASGAAPQAGGAAPPTGGGAGGAGEPAVKKSKPFYKSPVFWVVAAVGLYVLVVLAQDDDTAQPGRLMMPLPDGPGSAPAAGGATVFRF
ncbi:MAG: hypothetical protein HS111_03980 [Kofleriaceae bacterium]|nr:hypothetical protein [Kofleriaceae bacterium]